MAHLNGSSKPLNYHLQTCFQHDALDLAVVKIAKHENVYTCGGRDGKIYFIEKGRVKLVTLSPEGKECLLAIHPVGDIFGELCLVEDAPRQETATAMEDTVLRMLPWREFLRLVMTNLLHEKFIRYLTQRIADQQQVITRLVTVDTEHRLGETLLQLARRLGTSDPQSIRIAQKITHQELSEMIGTTRPRVTALMGKFIRLGLIAAASPHGLIIREKELSRYLSRQP
ncbi:MAG: Crp/Fnr family transcriptional regulator [Blastocatellia bacterium]|jgi:CRP/FNR family cyclic AMP-dependent transcriptional regulator